MLGDGSPREALMAKAELETIIEPWFVPTGENFAVSSLPWETIPGRRNTEDFKAPN